MNRISLLLFPPLLLAASAQAAEPVFHDITVEINPEKHQIKLRDEITFPEAMVKTSDRKLRFGLHGGLNPAAASPGVILHRETASEDGRVPVEQYTATLSADRRIVLTYEGEIHHPVREKGEEYTRGFSETPGIISSEGVFLAGSSYWHPVLGEERVTFRLEVTLPEGWDSVSQGGRTQHRRENGRTVARWESAEPQEEIYLIAGPFTEYTRTVGSINTMAFLRTPDEGLANQYLEATAQYLEMYRKLLGPYSYQKFALVENFWETGYGMPSFTLLGPQIIRFPFILHSSYPHEILHNWWGNGVYVEYDKGNWSEGLTTYLADHLIQEQRGTAADYRRATLQKYADYVSQNKDFALTEFRARHSSVTEAVGYGKTMMFFHMLRLKLGDDIFIKGLRRFYLERRFEKATLEDLLAAYETVTHENLRAEYWQWITRAGAPSLRVGEARAVPADDGYRLTAVIEQTQTGEPYRLRVPVAVHLEGRDTAHQTAVLMKDKRLELSVTVPARPVRLEIDPEFDLFRRLDRNEIPPALTQAFGADRVLILLPSAAPEPLREGYRRLAESWEKSHYGSIKIKTDSEVQALPNDGAVWIFGWENRFRTMMVDALKTADVGITDHAVKIGRTELTRDRHSVVLTARSVANPEQALTYLAAENPAALPGLGRKLPHYGKYGYLGFEGDEPTNVVKGEWPVVNSPLSVAVAQPDGRAVVETKGELSPRTALAALPPTSGFRPRRSSGF